MFYVLECHVSRQHPFLPPLLSLLSFLLPSLLIQFKNIFCAYTRTRHSIHSLQTTQWHLSKTRKGPYIKDIFGLKICISFLVHPILQPPFYNCRPTHSKWHTCINAQPQGFEWVCSSTRHHALSFSTSLEPHQHLRKSTGPRNSPLRKLAWCGYCSNTWAA